MSVTLGHGPTRLVLRNPSFDSAGAGTVLAELVSDSGLSAATDVYSFGGLGLGRFLGELADAWRGWGGPREWHSPEHHLTISASQGVVMTVTLRDSPNFTWKATADVEVDGGEELVRLAREVSALLGEQ
ncbi:MAG: hypothetical protein QOK28_3550 [Actinomycetota bacterium]|jgi:hypothetical protein